MNLLCMMFGHKAPNENGRIDDQFAHQFIRPDHPSRTNTGRVQIYLYGYCPRCEREYMVGLMWLRDATRFEYLEAHVNE